jgi:hypothetical protein
MVLGLAFSSTSYVQAGDAGPHRGGRQHRAHRHWGGQQGDVDVTCRTVMKTVERTVYEMVEETRTKTVYDIVWEAKVVDNVQRVPVTHHETQEYTYMLPVVQTLTREVPYVVNRPVMETLTRDVPYVTYVPVQDTHTRVVSNTVYHPVRETHTRTVYRSVPRKVTYTKTVPIHSGRWQTCVQEIPAATCDDSKQKGGGGSCQTQRVCKRVWVPHVEYREVTRCRTVYDQRAEEVPYTVTRYMPEVRTRNVEYAVTRVVPVTNTRTVSYQAMRLIPEQHTRTVAYNVTQMVPETGTRTVPVTTYREIPTSSTIHVARRVPRTVCYTVTRCVPRTECVQVPVTVCDPVDPKGGGKHKGDSIPVEMSPGDFEENAPAEVPETPAITTSGPTRLASLREPAQD